MFGEIRQYQKMVEEAKQRWWWPHKLRSISVEAPRHVPLSANHASTCFFSDIHPRGFSFFLLKVEGKNGYRIFVILIYV